MAAGLGQDQGQPGSLRPAVMRGGQRRGTMRRMATEIELKFRILPDRLAAVRRAVATASARVQPLAAAYFDTPGEHLARSRVALRLRREGAVWVQTLKAEGASAIQRLEHNVPLGAAADAGVVPALDLRRHDGTEAGAALRRVLAEVGDGTALAERYATDIQRTSRLLRSGGASIELALGGGGGGGGGGARRGRARRGGRGAGVGAAGRPAAGLAGAGGALGESIRPGAGRAQQERARPPAGRGPARQPADPGRGAAADGARCP